jgi:alkaline phosphatase D
MKDRQAFDKWLRTDVSRRSFLAGGLAAFGLGSSHLDARVQDRVVRFETSPFTLGVASGDPTSDGVVLWTRLAPNPLNGGGVPPVPVRVDWQMAGDDRMAKPVRSGHFAALPEWAHAVHVEVEGLKPDRWYWYQFRVGDQLSPIGRTRTLPPAGSRVDRLRFAFASCQYYEAGYFTALQHLAAEDLDLVFHLGDYIYEGSGSQGRPRSHSGPVLMTLDEYRARYAEYKTDTDLQSAHAAFPWIATWDDHEVANDYAGDISQRNDPRDLFLLRRAAAYRAYYEHMPLRRRSRPIGPSAQLYRGLSYGSLASFFVLDTRQYRTDQPCGERISAPCAGMYDQGATLLGEEQEHWLHDGLRRSASRWNVVPQQVMMAKLDRASGDESLLTMDHWAGYDATRTRLLRLFEAQSVSNPVILTGDVHNNFVNDLTLEPDSSAVATELVGTSISSGGDGSDRPDNADDLLAENPFVKFYNNQRGYVACEVTPTTMQAHYRVVEYVSTPGAPKQTRATFVIENGRPGAQRA